MVIPFSRLSRAFALCCGLALAADPALVVSGVSSAPLNLNLDDLAKLPRTTVAVKDHSYEGVLVAEVLKRAGMPLGPEMRGPLLASCVIAEAHDGYRALFSVSELDPAFTNGLVLIADRADGKPLSARDGPLKIVVPGDKRADRWVRGVERLRIVRIEVQTGRLSGTVDVELRAHDSHVLIAMAKEGVFRFPGVSPGTYDLRVIAAGFPQARIESITVMAGQNVEFRPVLLSTGGCGQMMPASFRLTGTDHGALSGSVVAHGGFPVGGARVRLVGSVASPLLQDNRDESAGAVGVRFVL
jgi:Oxidoreductase molybdopterin binding domain